MPTEKIDFHKSHKSEYVKPKKPALTKVGPARYLAIDGDGQPGDKLFQAQIGALYGAAWTIKMTKKFSGEADYKVCCLESLYWDCSMKHMNWRLLIRIPDVVKAADLKAAAKKLVEKGKGEQTENLRIEKLNERTVVQVLHLGPYNTVGKTIEKMMAFAAEQGMEPGGLYHEIYISDPNRVAPEKLKTICRLPVKKRS